MKTLTEVLNEMKRIKELDVNDEVEVFFDAGRPVIQGKKILIFANPTNINLLRTPKQT